jgi:hypothetical protein
MRVHAESTGRIEGYVLLMAYSDSRLFGSQILVFHFPGMVQGVKGGVPN